MNKEKILDILQKATAILAKARRYSLIIFIAFVASLYGFVIFRISVLTNIKPTDAQVSQQVQTAHILSLDKTVIKQLQALQDNSVEVQTLFNQARSNPFQEN